MTPNGKQFIWRALCYLAFAAMTPAFAANSGNLIVNGNAEVATCTTDWKAVTTVPGWTVTKGSPVAVCYSISSFATPDATANGKAFLADGPYGDSTLTQTVDVAAAGAAIDGGAVTYTLSGWLGGWGSATGEAQVAATFLGAGGQTLTPSGPAQLSGVTPAARGNTTKFLAKSNTGTVPIGTRSILVTVKFVNTGGSYNVGYADNLSLTLSTPLSTAALAAPASTVPPFDHVFIIMMENTYYEAVMANLGSTPFIKSVIDKGTLLTNSSGTYHPSDQNYLSIAGGDTFVQGAIYFPNIKVTANHIGDRIEAAGKTWKAYEQGMGTPCNLVKSGYYSPDDAPFANFTNISSSSNKARCQAHLFDTTQLTTDLASAATTPHFSWIAADDWYDGEASGQGNRASLIVQDGWLNQTIQPIFDSPAWKNQRSLLILTWDESHPSDAVSNHIATVLVGSQGLVNAGAASGVSYDHYSVARTIESALGLAPLTANDQYARPINDAFTVLPNATLSTLTQSVSAGASIGFNYATPAAKVSATNWVGLYRAGDTPGSVASLKWQYAPNGSGSVSLSTTGLAAGNYAAWYLYNDGFTVLAGPTGFTVTP